MAAKNRIWLDGAIVEYEDATTHVLSHTLHYGLATFEGIRSYQTIDGKTAVFRLEDHIDRLVRSSRAATIDLAYSAPQMCDAVREVLRNNALTDCYIRPLAWLGEGSIRIAALDNVVHVAIAAWPWGAYLGDKALELGVRCKVSSYTRIGIRSHLEKAKVSGQYVNSVLAKREANRDGYDEAILLDAQGHVAEGTGENIFVVRGGVLYTPPRGASILAGITRDTILTLAKDAQIAVREENITRSDVYMADEVFLTGTAAEVTPVCEIDRRAIGTGKRGEMTRFLQDAYFGAVRGKNEQHLSWLSYV